MQLPGPLVSTQWLSEQLAAPGLCILDTTVFLHLNADKSGYKIESGLAKWAEAHLPGAQFVDLVDAFSDPASEVPFTMPSAERFCELAGALGVGDDSTVVVYSASTQMWATRLWWMFRSVGFDRCAVLDGGFEKWQSENRPVPAEKPATPPCARLTPNPRPRLWAGKQDMVRAMDDGAVCTINALSPDVYSGQSNRYGRPGHIPGSHNVFYDSLLDPADGTYLPPARLKERFEEVGAFERSRAVVYCGGGISATMDALGLVLAGHPDIAVYDGSMWEWAADPALPLTLGSGA